MSLRTRLILSYALIIVLCLSIAAASLLVLFQNYRDKLAMARLTDMALPISVQVRALARGQVSLNEIWERVQEQSDATGIAIFVLDRGGDVVKQASPEGKYWEAPKLTSKVLAQSKQRPARGTYITSKGETFIYAAFSLTGLFKPLNPNSPETLVLAMPRQNALGFLLAYARPFLWAGLIALVVSVVIAFVLARSVYMPVRRISEAADRIAQGNYDQEVPIKGDKEVKGLALSFNQMARQVKQSQQTLRDFVANVSHELRSPLTSIKGFAQAITDGTAKDKQSQNKAASIIEDESKRMMRLVDDLLELSKLESGQITMAREAVDIKELLEHCRDIFAMRAEEKGVKLTLEMQPLSAASGDIDRLEQVFNNLIDNALKHTPKGGKVSITAYQPATSLIEVTVSDTGQGIPPEELRHVFERFYRVNNSGTKTGTGLGLAIAKEIIKAHGGNIAVFSKLNDGTRFVVTLPASPTVPPPLRS
ncbi:MAG: cell wall metabolism sensor histidine kinase WalK [Chloroflexi bacterium]|nr:cell wall metabolism sensor histidine kinase WalK [Chloroflexota bacterium]